MAKVYNKFCARKKEGQVNGYGHTIFSPTNFWRMKMYLVVSFLLFSLIVNGQARQWIQFEGNGSGAGKGKHIVFVSGDEEYRSEEALPMMA